MANGISWGSLAVGAVVGGIVIYAVTSRKKAVLEKEKKELKPTKIPSEEIPPEGAPPKWGDLPTVPAGVSMHREPKPQQKVWIPQTPADRVQLDEIICRVWNIYDAPPDLSDFMMDVLDDIAPEGEWPTVPGDHASLPSLQAIVGYRIDQIGQLDSTKSIEENFDAFCIGSVGIPPEGLGEIGG